MKLLILDSINCREEEHRYASDVLLGSDIAAHLALIKLREIAAYRKFLTKSPVNVALVALNSSSIAIQTQAALILLSVADRQTATALRWKLAESPHEMVASVLKEALAKANRRRKS